MATKITFDLDQNLIFKTSPYKVPNNISNNKKDVAKETLLYKGIKNASLFQQGKTELKTFHRFELKSNVIKIILNENYSKERSQDKTVKETPDVTLKR